MQGCVLGAGKKYGKMRRGACSLEAWSPGATKECILSLGKAVTSDGSLFCPYTLWLFSTQQQYEPVKSQVRWRCSSFKVWFCISFRTKSKVLPTVWAALRYLAFLASLTSFPASSLWFPKASPLGLFLILKLSSHPLALDRSQPFLCPEGSAELPLALPASGLFIFDLIRMLHWPHNIKANASPPHQPLLSLTCFICLQSVFPPYDILCHSFWLLSFYYHGPGLYAMT